MKIGDVPLIRYRVWVSSSLFNRGIIWRDSVLNRVFNFVQVGPLFSLGIILTGGLRVLPSEDQHIRHLKGYSFLLRLNNL